MHETDGMDWIDTYDTYLDDKNGLLLPYIQPATYINSYLKKI